MSDWLEWLIKIGSVITAATLILGLMWWLARRWELLQRLDKMAEDWHGKPPDREHPDGQPGVMLRLDRQDQAIARVANIATNGLSTNVARSLEYSERAVETAAEAKEAARLAAEQGERLLAGQAALTEEVGRLSQRMREKKDVSEAVIDKVTEIIMRDDEGTDGST